MMKMNSDAFDFSHLMLTGVIFVIAAIIPIIPA